MTEASDMSDEPRPAPRVPRPAARAPQLRVRALADAVGRGGSYGAGASRWIIETFSAAPLIVPASVEIRVGSAEQSNTSVILGEQGILKLFRKLEQGPHPDVELTRFLTMEAKF